MIKRGKKGQVTLFIIIAIIIVALVVLSIVLWPKLSALFISEERAQIELGRHAESLQTNVHDCVEIVSLEIFGKLGLQAGYYTTEHLTAIDFAGPKYIVMYKDADKVRINKLPSLNAIANEFKGALEDEGYDKINACLNNFDSFKKVIEVEPGAKEIKAEIRNEDIIIKVDWPVTISKGKASQIIKQKDVELLIPLGNVWRVANDIVTSEVQQENFEGINWDEHIIDNQFLLQYIKYESRSLNENQIAFLIESIPYRAGEKPYLFYFAIDRT